jgi:protein O-GlcNAc transferase
VTQARFAARGVAPERVVFAGHSGGEAYFESFREVDLMLDAWPAPGSTTTLDALSNGVPVLAKPTPTSGGHCVRTILEAAGLPELIAESPEDFVARALDLTADFARLDALRARVGPGFEGGAIGDEVGFTRRVEAAFGAMFDRWRLVTHG